MKEYKDLTDDQLTDLKLGLVSSKRSLKSQIDTIDDEIIAIKETLRARFEERAWNEKLVGKNCGI